MLGIVIGEQKEESIRDRGSSVGKPIARDASNCLARQQSFRKLGVGEADPTNPIQHYDQQQQLGTPMEAISLCDCAVFDDRDGNVGGICAPVIVVTTGVNCKGNHPLILLFDRTSIRAVYNQVALPVKNGSPVFSAIIGVQLEGGEQRSGREGTGGRVISPDV